VSYNISYGFYWSNSPSFFEYFIIIREISEKEIRELERAKW